MIADKQTLPPMYCGMKCSTLSRSCYVQALVDADSVDVRYLEVGAQAIGYGEVEGTCSMVLLDGKTMHVICRKMTNFAVFQCQACFPPRLKKAESELASSTATSPASSFVTMLGWGVISGLKE